MLGTLARGALTLNRMRTKSVRKNVDMDEMRSNEANERTNIFLQTMSDNMKKKQNTLRWRKECRKQRNHRGQRRFKECLCETSGLYSVNKILYICGTTGKDESITRDILDDLYNTFTNKERRANRKIQRCHELSKTIHKLLGSFPTALVVLLPIQSMKISQADFKRQPMQHQQ